MAAARKGKGKNARKTRAAQTRGRATARRAGARSGRDWQEEERGYALGNESAQSFARGTERAARALHSDFAQPVGEGLELIMRSWMGFFQRAALTQQRLVQDMLELGSGRRAFEVQRAFLDESLRNFSDSTKEVLRASGRIAEPAVRTAERAAGLAQAYEDHAEAQAARGTGNGRSSFGGRRSQEEAHR